MLGGKSGVSAANLLKGRIRCATNYMGFCLNSAQGISLKSS